MNKFCCFNFHLHFRSKICVANYSVSTQGSQLRTNFDNSCAWSLILKWFFVKYGNSQFRGIFNVKTLFQKLWPLLYKRAESDLRSTNIHSSYWFSEQFGKFTLTYLAELSSYKCYVTRFYILLLFGLIFCGFGCFFQPNIYSLIAIF